MDQNQSAFSNSLSPFLFLLSLDLGATGMEQEGEDISTKITSLLVYYVAVADSLVAYGRSPLVRVSSLPNPPLDHPSPQQPFSFCRVQDLTREVVMSELAIGKSARGVMDRCSGNIKLASPS